MLKKFLHEIGGGVKIHSAGGTPFPCYSKFEPHQYLTKNWVPCVTELEKMKKKLDKLVPVYEDSKNFGQLVKAKRIFKKALQISKRVTELLGREAHANSVTKEETDNAKASA